MVENKMLYGPQNGHDSRDSRRQPVAGPELDYKAHYELGLVRSETFCQAVLAHIRDEFDANGQQPSTPFDLTKTWCDDPSRVRIEASAINNVLGHHPDAASVLGETPETVMVAAIQGKTKPQWYRDREAAGLPVKTMPNREIFPLPNSFDVPLTGDEHLDRLNAEHDRAIKTAYRKSRKFRNFEAAQGQRSMVVNQAEYQAMQQESASKDKVIAIAYKEELERYKQLINANGNGKAKRAAE